MTRDVIAFSSYRDGRLDIYTMGTNGEHIRNLTNDSQPDFQPAWSPDGARIAYVSLDVTTSHFDQIYTMSPSGDERARVTAFDGGNPQEPAWSRDGTKIAFHVVFGGAIDSEIYTMGADGSDLTQITHNASEDSNPSWSPDGSRLAFVRDAHIETMRADGSDVRSVTPPRMLAFDPAWSPNGHRIVFVGRRPGGSQDDLFVIRPDGSRLRRLTKTKKTESTPTWSPDGASVAYALTQIHPESDEEDHWILTMRTDGAHRMRLSIDGTTRDTSPDWGIERSVTERQFQTPSSSPDETRARIEPRARRIAPRLRVAA